MWAENLKKIPGGQKRNKNKDLKKGWWWCEKDEVEGVESIDMVILQ